MLSSTARICGGAFGGSIIADGSATFGTVVATGACVFADGMGAGVARSGAGVALAVDAGDALADTARFGRAGCAVAETCGAARCAGVAAVRGTKTTGPGVGVGLDSCECAHAVTSKAAASAGAAILTFNLSLFRKGHRLHCPRKAVLWIQPHPC